MIPVFPAIFRSSVVSSRVNAATLFTMLCSDIGIHLDSNAFSEILNRREVRAFRINIDFIRSIRLYMLWKRYSKGCLKQTRPLSSSFQLHCMQVLCQICVFKQTVISSILLPPFLETKSIAAILHMRPTCLTHLAHLSNPSLPSSPIISPRTKRPTNTVRTRTI